MDIKDSKDIKDLIIGDEKPVFVTENVHSNNDMNRLLIKNSTQYYESQKIEKVDFIIDSIILTENQIKVADAPKM